MNTLETMPLWLEISVSVLILFGAGFALIGSWGLVRFSDFFSRAHGPTKASTLGVGCVLLASAIWFSVRSGAPSVHELLVALFLFLTAPVSAHMLAVAVLTRDPALCPPIPDKHGSLPSSDKETA
jgi:multicomponent K+:H+ antiporter subunit G